MSDIPENYYVNGQELLGFRREINLGFVVPAKKKKSSNGHGHRKFLQALIDRDGIFCHYCQCRLQKGPLPGQKQHFPNEISIDHIYPKSLGGKNSIKNLVLACRKCNNGFGSILNKCSCSFCVEAVKRKGDL